MSLEVNMNTQEKRVIPKYTLEFKQDAARLVNEKDYTHQQVVDHYRYSRFEYISHIIFYRQEKDFIVISRVIHQSRDVKALLSK